MPDKGGIFQAGLMAGVGCCGVQCEVCSVQSGVCSLDCGAHTAEFRVQNAKSKAQRTICST